MTEPVTQFFYWCNVLEAWVQCTQDEYMRIHYGKSFTKIQEIT
jgi:hypothetical protein